MTSVLIVGGSSFIGRNLIDRLISEYQDWNITGTYCNSKNFKEFASERGIESIKVDLTEDVPNLGNHEVVVYTPTITPGQLREDPAGESKLEDINGHGVKKIVDATEGIEKFVYLSSGAVHLVAEKNSPLENYIEAKILGENVTKSQSIKHAFVPQILRNMETYGRYMAKHKIFRRLMEVCSQGEKEFTLMGGGTNLLDTMYIDDYTLNLASGLKHANGPVRIDYGKGEPVTMLDLAKTCAKVCKNDEIEFKLQGKSTEDVQFMVKSYEFEDFGGTNAHVSLEEGLTKWLDEGLK